MLLMIKWLPDNFHIYLVIISSSPSSSGLWESQNLVVLETVNFKFLDNDSEWDIIFTL